MYITLCDICPVMFVRNLLHIHLLPPAKLATLPPPNCSAPLHLPQLSCNHIHLTVSHSLHLSPSPFSTLDKHVVRNTPCLKEACRRVRLPADPIGMSTPSNFAAWRRDQHAPLPHLSEHTAVNASSPLRVATTGLLTFYAACNPRFRFLQSVPRRCLTKPSQPAHNNNYDNISHDYILHVNDTLSDDHGNQFAVLDLLGTGTFGQVVKCRHLRTGDIVAVKVIKNQPAYFNQAWVEINILRMLHRNNSEEDTKHIVRFVTHFIFRGHLCLVFEKLSINLYELLKQGNYVGLNLETLRSFLIQLLQALNVLVRFEVIHCDLKPENILLKSLDTADIKVIDFGSACQLHYPIYSYVQSRFYRSPEVLLGCPEYDSKIDMWSLGCVAAELFLGIPLFPGQNEMNMICRIVEMLGDMPDRFLRRCRHTNKFFNSPRSADYPADAMHVYQLKSLSQYERESNVKLPEWKRFFKEKKLRDIIMTFPHRTLASHSQETANRESFIDLLNGMLRIDPVERWTPAEALQHPFIFGQPLPGSQPWCPPTKSMRVMRSRPVVIEVPDEGDPTLLDEVYSASAPNFTAKGHLNMNTTWGTGAGGQPAFMRTSNGMFQLHHQNYHHTLPPLHSTVGYDSGGTNSPSAGQSSFAPGSYIPSSAYMYGASQSDARARHGSLRGDGVSNTASAMKSGSHEHGAFLFSSPGAVGEAHPQMSGVGESPSALGMIGTPPLPYGAALRLGNNLTMSTSKESLTGSIRLSGSRESLGFGRVPSVGDMGEDPIFPFGSDDEAFTPMQQGGHPNSFVMPAHQLQMQQHSPQSSHHPQIVGAGSGASAALPPPAPRLLQGRGSTSAAYGQPSNLSFGYTTYTNQQFPRAFSSVTGAPHSTGSVADVMDVHHHTFRPGSEHETVRSMFSDPFPALTDAKATKGTEGVCSEGSFSRKLPRRGSHS